VIEYKANELSRFLIRRSTKFDFAEPEPKLQRLDNRELRTKILGLTASEARQLGIRKSTLHYLRKNAKANSTHRLYAPVIEKLSRNGEGH
jgi:CRISPR-associated protein Cas1